jgi:hypothetical protein
MALSSWFLPFTDRSRYERRQNLTFLDDSVDQICRLGIRDIARRLKVLPLGSSIAQELEEISPEEMLPVRKRLPGNCKFNQPWTQDMRIPPASRRRSNDPPGPRPSAPRGPQEATDSHNLNTIIENPGLPARGLASLSNLPSTLCPPPQNTIAFDDSALSGPGPGPDLTRPQWGSTNAMASSTAGAAFSGYTPLTGVECQELSLPQWGSLQTMACSAAEDVYCEFGLRTWLEGSDSTLRTRSTVPGMDSSMDFMEHLHPQPVR